MKEKKTVGEHSVKDLVRNKDYIKIVAVIDKEVDYVDVRPYSHNIIGFALREASEKFGTEVANDLIDEFGLEDLGWKKEK